jgi:hypothetical protein
MKKIPKGKGRKSNAETYRDAMLCLKLADHDCLTEEQIVEKTGLSRSTVYRLLSRARSSVLAPQNKANREAAEPSTKKWYELSSPEPVDLNLTPGRSEYTGTTELSDRGVKQSSGDDGPPPSANLTEPPQPPPVVEHDLGIPGTAQPSVVEHQPANAPERKPSSGSQMKSAPKIRPYEPTPRPVRKPGEDDLTWKTRWRRWQVDEQVAENMLQGAMGPVLRGKKNLGVCFGNCPAYACRCHDEGAFDL